MLNYEAYMIIVILSKENYWLFTSWLCLSHYLLNNFSERFSCGDYQSSQLSSKTYLFHLSLCSFSPVLATILSRLEWYKWGRYNQYKGDYSIYKEDLNELIAGMINTFTQNVRSLQRCASPIAESTCFPQN